MCTCAHVFMHIQDDANITTLEEVHTLLTMCINEVYGSLYPALFICVVLRVASAAGDMIWLPPMYAHAHLFWREGGLC